MRQLALLLIVIANCLALCMSGAEAAKKKPAALPIKKEIYEAPMRVVIVRNSSDACEPKCPEWIAAEGEINETTPAAFRKVFKQMGKKKLPVTIRSPGGSITAALEVGKMLRERKMTVAVGFTRYNGCAPDDQKCKLPKESKGIFEGQIYEYGAFCNSACPMLLSGGTTRLASAVAYIGLHEPKTIWTRTQYSYRDHYKIVKGKKKVTRRQILSSKTRYDKTTFGFDKRLRKRLTAYYKSMGVDVAIIDESMKAKYQDINYIADDLKTKLGLRTSNQSAVLLGNPKLCGNSGSSAFCVENKARVTQVSARQVLTIEEGLRKHGPMTFQAVRSNEDSCETRCVEWISATGSIELDSADKFAAFLEKEQKATRFVVLNSLGGSFEGSLRLGRLIHKRGISTVVGFSLNEPCGISEARRCKWEGRDLYQVGQITTPAICSGSCALVFASGKLRIADHLRLPSIRTFSPSNNQASIEEQLMAYFEEIGYVTTIVEAMKKLRQESFLDADHAKLQQLELVNSNIPLGELHLNKGCTSKESPATCILR